MTRPCPCPNCGGRLTATGTNFNWNNQPQVVVWCEECDFVGYINCFTLEEAEETVKTWEEEPWKG